MPPWPVMIFRECNILEANPNELGAGNDLSSYWPKPWAILVLSLRVLCGTKKQRYPPKASEATEKNAPLKQPSGLLHVLFFPLWGWQFTRSCFFGFMLKLSTSSYTAPTTDGVNS